jgi:hypothetical protein
VNLRGALGTLPVMGLRMTRMVHHHHLTIRRKVEMVSHSLMILIMSHGAMDGSFRKGKKSPQLCGLGNIEGGLMLPFLRV